MYTLFQGSVSRIFALGRFLFILVIEQGYAALALQGIKGTAA